MYRYLVLLYCLILSGCSGITLLHAIDQGQALTPEQIQAYRQSNVDVYTCFQIGGPPPAGNTITIMVPKDKPAPFKFGDNCHLITQ